MLNKNDHSDIKKYRPISVLPTISKLFENVLQTQLMKYFTSLYIGLSKALDSLKYNILITKLQYYGLQNNELLLLKSYLHEKSQYVRIENVKSCSHPVVCGSAQGFERGELLFNIFINDIPKATSEFKVIMYADDTTLVSHLENIGPVNDINAFEQEINKEISKVNTWLLSNKLLLNVAKSKFKLFLSTIEQYQNSVFQSMAIQQSKSPILTSQVSHLIRTLHRTIIYKKISIKVLSIMNKFKHKLFSTSNSTNILKFSHPSSSHLWIIYLVIFPKTRNNTYY